MSASHTRRSRRGQPSTTLEGGDQTPVSVPPTVSTQSIQGVPIQVSNDQTSDEEFYNSPSNSDEPDLNDFGSSAEDEIDPSDPRRMFNPHEPYDKKLGLSPAFVHCVLTIGLTGHMVRSLVGLSITEPDTLFVMKEEELMSKCAFEFVHIMGFRIAQHEWKESRRPIPSGVLGTLPRFRGTHQLSIQEPFAFLTQFESVLTACSTPKRVWPKFLTLCLTKPEDVSFWKYYLEIHPGLLWSDYAQAFLQHFERYNQQLKWMEQITTLKQDAKEKICSYLDRSADIARRAGRSLDDETFLYYLRKGISSYRLISYIDNKEQVGQKWTFALFSEAALMGEDRLEPVLSPNQPRIPQHGAASSSSDRIICRNCNKAGHKRQDCPRSKSASKDRPRKEREPKRTPVMNPCSRCPDADHIYSKCPLNTCDTCKLRGHLSFNCPQATCSACKMKGHTPQSFDCPKNPKAKRDKNKQSSGYLTGVSPSEEDMSMELLEFLGDKTDAISWILDKEERDDRIIILAATQFGNGRSAIHVPVTVNGESIMAVLDTLSSDSVMSQNLCTRLKLWEQTQPVTVTVRTAFVSHDDLQVCLTPPIQLKCGGNTLTHQFYVSDIFTELIIGIDLFYRLGFGISDVPTSFPVNQTDATSRVTSSDVENVDNVDGTFSKLRRIPEIELQELMRFLEPTLSKNEKIGEDEFCNHHAAMLRIPLKDSIPIYRPQFEIPARLHSVIEDQIQKWLVTKKIEPANPLNRWNSSLLLAPKRDLYGQLTEWRVCFDGRGINTKLEPDTYGIPRIKELFRRVSGFLYCSALDLVAAFHQVPIAPEDCYITTFTWKGRRYQFTGAPFGLSIIPGHFQRLMTDALQAHARYVLIYIDDLFIFSNTLDEHKTHCKAVIETLTKYNLRLRRQKCHFGYREAQLLGHIIDGASIRVDPSKVSTFVNLKTPSTGKQVQALLGFSSYLRDYIPMYSKIAHPLEAIKLCKDVTKHWQSEQQTSFDLLKQILSNAPIISTADFTKPLKVATDASQFGIGAVLYQQEEPTDKPKYLAFFSRALNRSQKNYPATKRELLAIVASLKAFRYFLYGNRFELYTDHKALVFMFTAKDLSYMLQNWMEDILEFDFKVIHRPGVEMILPDALSRLYRENRSLYEGSELALIAENEERTEIIVAATELSQASNVCKLCTKRVKRSCATQHCNDHCPGCPVHPKPTPSTSNTVDTLLAIDDDVAETVNADIKEIIKSLANKKDPGSSELRETEVLKAHEFNHSGSHALFMYLFRNGWYWPKMRRDCRSVVANCPSCLQFNVGRRGFHPLRTINATYPFDHVAIDLGQIATTSTKGNNYFLVLADICTRFVLIRALPDKAALTVARTLYQLFTDFGLPKILQSDNGSEFKNQVISHLHNECGLQHRFTTPYYPQANGVAEASVKNTKFLLKKIVKGDYTDWCVHLPSIQMAINSRVTKRHHSTPFSLMFTRPFNMFHNTTQQALPQPMSEQEIIDRNQILIDLLYPALRSSTDAHNQQMMDDFKLSHRMLKRGYPNGAMVMKMVDEREGKMNPAYEGPFKVLNRTATNTYVLLDNTGALYPKNVPASALKLISVPDYYLADNDSYEVETILNHRGPAQSREYLVKWKGYPHSSNTWVKAQDFNSTLCVSDYWKKKKPRK
ncbi:MAG: RNase H-like domain-containing protein [Candidatus Paceibacterota bacterium]